ncbi:MAG: hypothetical protein AB8G96_09085 [Phycisphaerales bacterium]
MPLHDLIRPTVAVAALAAASGTLLTTAPARATETAAATTAATTTTTTATATATATAEPPYAFLMHSSGVDAIMPDERDAILRQVLRLLPDRMMELSGELPDFPELPEPMVRGIAASLQSPMSLALDFGDPNDPEAGPPVAGQFVSWPEDPAIAAGLAQMLIGIVESEGATFQPSDVEGLMQTEAPFGMLNVGTRPVNGQPALVLGVNASGASIPMPTDHGLPAGVEPAMSVRFDLGRLAPMIQQMMESEGASEEDMALMTRFGFGGDTPIVGSMAYGHAADRSHAIIRLRDYAALSEQAGLPADVAIDVAEFRAVPRDAVFVSSNVTPLPRLGALLEEMMASVEPGANPEEFWGEAEEALGFHPRRDLLDHLGDTITVYRSEATGGGGMMSTIGLFELADAGSIADTHANLVERFNAEATPQLGGYVSIRPWSMDGRDLFTLSFNGVPIPLQLTWGIEASRLVIGASPPAVIAAMKQLTKPAGSFADRADLVAMAGGNMNGLTAFRYVDTERAARRGYSGATMVATALANAVRSPRTQRDPGAPMPAYSDFIDGVVPLVTTSRWEDGDLVTRVQTDRSSMVSMAAGVDAAGGLAGLAVAGVAIGALQPALQQARMNAMGVKSMSQVRAMLMATEAYRANHDGVAPADMAALVANEYATEDLFVSPYGPSWDGGPDYTYRPVTGAIDGDPAERMVILDRMMLITQGETAVGFADGHIERLGTWEIAEHLKMPMNEGAAEVFGILDEVRWYLEP